MRKFVGVWPLLLVSALAACGGSNGTTREDPPPPAFKATAIGFVANAKSNSISSFLLDETTGALAIAATAPTGRMPGFPAATPDGRFLYVNNAQDGSVSRFRLDGAGGIQSAGTAVNLVDANAQPAQIAIAPSGKFLYVGTAPHAVEAFAVDGATGNLIPLPNSPFTVGSQAISVAIAHSGELLFASGNDADAIYIFTIDTSSGTLNPVATVRTGLATCALAIDPADKYLLVNACSGRLLVFAIEAGILRETNSSRIASAYLGTSLAIAPNGRLVFMADPFWRGDNSDLVDNGILAYTLDTASGAIASVSGSPFTDNQSPGSVAVSPSGEILVVARINPGHMASYRIDQAGALSPISGRLSDSGIATGNSPNHVLLIPRQ